VGYRRRYRSNAARDRAVQPWAHRYNMRRAQAFADRYQRVYPAAVACLTKTLPELTCYLRFPTEHWSRIRHSNLIEWTFARPAAGPKVIGRLPGERSCLSLVWRCWIGLAAAGGVSYRPRPRCACSRSCAANSSTHQRSRR
jgi:transposase-like protein